MPSLHCIVVFNVSDSTAKAIVGAELFSSVKTVKNKH